MPPRRAFLIPVLVCAAAAAQPSAIEGRWKAHFERKSQGRPVLRFFAFAQMGGPSNVPHPVAIAGSFDRFFFLKHASAAIAVGR
jgi:hypothetical protein